MFNDSTFSYQGRRYSVPPRYIGKTVTIKHRPGKERLEVYYQDQAITEHRTDSGGLYIIKRSHRHQIWKVWRNGKDLFYQQAKQQNTPNHPLSVYEEIAATGVNHG